MSSSLHRRQPSNTLRISMPEGGEGSTSNSPSRRTNGLSSSPTSLARIMSTPFSRRSRNGAILGPGRKRILVSVLSVALVYVLYHSFSTSARAADGSPDKWTLWDRLRGPGRGMLDMDSVHQVNRTILEKLRLLEQSWGGPDEEHHETAHEDDDWDRNDLDGPPLVDHIPERPKVPKISITVTSSSASTRPTPSQVAPSPPQHPLVPGSELDPLYCPSFPCSFLLAAWVGEQETKAQQHLHQLGLLALSLNRTLVLPNVIRSRMGTCFAKPFSFYYEADSLKKLGVPSITYDQFKKWSVRRFPSPTGQIISMPGDTPQYPHGAVEVDSSSDPSLVPGKTTRNLCLGAGKTGLKFERWSPLTVFAPKGWWKTTNSQTAFGHSVVGTLSSSEVYARSDRETRSSDSDLDSQQVSPDVLAFNYELRFPIFEHETTPPLTTKNPTWILPSPQPFSYFSYSSTWTSLASLISQNLGQYIAIHWRTEMVPPNSLVPCAKSLIDKLHDIEHEYENYNEGQQQQQHPLRTVYFATDYPIEDLEDQMQGTEWTPENARPHSGTFAKVVTPEHHEAMKHFLSSFSTSLPNMRLTTYAREQSNIIVPQDLAEELWPGGGARQSLADLDPGLLGIVDKTVASGATVFLTGYAARGPDTESACGKHSSFTRQIILNRQEARRGQDGDKFWNDVEYWSRGSMDSDVD